MRRWQQIPGYGGIAKLIVYDASKGRWVEPRGSRYRANGYKPDSSGEPKRVRPVFKSFDEAKKFRAEFACERFTEHEAPSPHEEMVFDQLSDIWKAESLPHRALPTQIRYLSYFRHFDFFKGIKVGSIVPVTIDGWITNLKRPENLAAGHTTRCDFRHEFSLLRVILNFYSTRFDRNYRLPFIKDHRNMLTVREKIKLTKDLTVDEFQRFIVALRTECVGTWEVIYYIALMQYAIYGRIQDVAALHFEDFGRAMLVVNKKAIWLRVMGHQSYIEDGSKANGGKEIPMPELAMKVFREWTLKSGIRQGLLFPLDGALIEYRQIEYRYNRAMKSAGLPFTATHILRHAALSECYDTCEDILTTQKMAGHGDLKSTTRYAKVRDKKVRQVQKDMDLKLAGLLDQRDA